MKKRLTRLQLCKETIRTLNDAEIGNAAGGSQTLPSDCTPCTGTNCRISLCICP